jgi:Predicted hydrolase (HAD superfamily)
MRKPGHCFYEHVLKETSTASSEAIFIDDKKENALATQEVGMTGLLFDGTKTDEVRGKAADSIA